MTITKTVFFIQLLLFSFLFTQTGCKNETKLPKEKKTTNIITQEEITITGNYVSDEYVNRNEGYDWVSVSVTKEKNDKLKISIRSRADKKKPSCTFDAIAIKLNKNTYQTQKEGKTILFKFNNDEIIIMPKNETDSNLLYFYCSGGATIAGTYKKIGEPLDQNQIDKTKFSTLENF